MSATAGRTANLSREFGLVPSQQSKRTGGWLTILVIPLALALSTAIRSQCNRPEPMTPEQIAASVFRENGLDRFLILAPTVSMQISEMGCSQLDRTERELARLVLLRQAPGGATILEPEAAHARDVLQWIKARAAKDGCLRDPSNPYVGWHSYGQAR
ncbi:MAG: hypothetical protein JSS66_10795 [Armatimonadetes bacterium]|nr:hypothetical protein [Armatimonadota bacterium]